MLLLVKKVSALTDAHTVGLERGSNEQTKCHMYISVRAVMGSAYTEQTIACLLRLNQMSYYALTPICNQLGS